jgi:hypothetical protein
MESLEVIESDEDYCEVIASFPQSRSLQNPIYCQTATLVDFSLNIFGSLSDVDFGLLPLKDTLPDKVNGFFVVKLIKDTIAAYCDIIKL